MTSDFHPIAFDRHANKQWFAPRNLGFASSQHLLPILNAEIGAAARTLPLAFVRIANQTTLVAVLGLAPGSNLFVGQGGQWLGLYIPALLRSHPFRLAKATEDRLVLCIDEGSGLVKDAGIGEGGNAFFDAEGKAAPETARMMDFMSTLQKAEAVTVKAVQALETAGLLEDWPLVVGEGAQAQNVQGLQRIDEKRLNALDGQALVDLRQAGGLAIAYAQLISIGNIELLTRIQKARQTAQTAKAQQAAIRETDFLSDSDGSLKIDWNTILN